LDPVRRSAHMVLSMLWARSRYLVLSSGMARSTGLVLSAITGSLPWPGALWVHGSLFRSLGLVLSCRTAHDRSAGTRGHVRIAGHVKKHCNRSRCQRFSHVYSRPTQPLQDSQRDRRNERPDHITEFVCEDCGDHVHVFGHYYGLPVHSTCPLHPRTSDMPEHIIKGHLRGDT
jgi:hypothetical protein